MRASFVSDVLGARPYHAGLLVGTETQLFVKRLLVARAQPEELHAAQRRMVQNMLHELGPDVLALVIWIHDHIPDGGAKDIVGQDAAKADQSVAVPGRNGQIGVLQHFPCLLDRPTDSPRSHLVEPDELREIELLAFGKGDGTLEQDCLLILEYRSVHSAPLGDHNHPDHRERRG